MTMNFTIFKRRTSANKETLKRYLGLKIKADSQMHTRLSERTILDLE